MILMLLQDYAVMWLALVVHELGHLAAARSLGLPVIGVSVGEQEVVSRSWRGIRFRVGWIPLGGSVIMAWPSRRRWKNWTVTLAGPLANLATAVLLLAGEPRSFVHDLYVMSLLLFGYNLLAIWKPETDGAQLLAEFRRDREGILTR